MLSIKQLGTQQEIQKQVMQSNDLKIQQEQIQLTQAHRDQQDHEATSKAWLDSGGDPQKFQALLPQYGASYEASQRAKMGQAAVVEQLSKADKETFEAHKSANTLIGQNIETIANAPPEDQAAQYTLITNGMRRDPQLSKYLPANLPPQYPGPDALKSAMIGVGMNDALMKQAEENRKAAQAVPELATKQSEAIIKDAEAKAVQAGGIAPGIPLETQAANAWLKKPENAGKDASDFIAWKAKQSPAAITLLNQLGGGGTGSALDQAAERYSKDGSLPAGFGRSPGTTAAIIKRSAELHPDQDIAVNKATFSADTAALKKVQTTFDQVSAFENTALRNLDLYVEKARAIPDIGVRFANVPLRAITKGMIGDANYAAMETARQTAATEAAKVLGSANASGVLSDSQKREALDVLDGKLPLAATIKVVDTFKQDFANRHAGYQQDIDAIKARLAGKPQSQTQPQGSDQAGSGKAVSLAAAKQLPAMKGKTDDEIKQAIKAAGHQVAP